MARHTTMPPRIQKTPHGDVALTSKWMRDHYMLSASGTLQALHWMFPNMTDSPEQRGPSWRHAFEPAPMKITVERDLRRICAQWQAKWYELCEDWQHQISGGSCPARLAISTLGQLFDHLYEHRKATTARSTSDRDRYRLRLWRDELGNGTQLIDLDAERVRMAFARIGRRTSAATANPALGVLRTYLNWAANMGLLKDQGYRTVKPLKDATAQRHHRAWWTAGEIELALRCAAQDHHQPTATLLVACGCYLGLRVEEIVMLRWQDLSLDAIDPQTKEPRPVCHVTPHDGWEPKDGEARDIPICKQLLAILLNHRQSDGYLLNAEPDRLVTSRTGTGWNYRYNPKKVWARIMKAVRAAGGKPITMYGMRHSFASNYLIANVSDVKVSRWLGHADTRMVHRHYGHLLSYDDDINAV